jgi:hypothetical protein
MVNQIYQDFEKFQFTNQVKYPRNFIHEDSTKAYVPKKENPILLMVL